MTAVRTSRSTSTGAPVSRRQLLKAGGSLVGAAALGHVVVAGALAQSQGQRIQWRIGSQASARSTNSVRITFTGSGTFVAGAPREVSGGGTFKVTMPDGSLIFEGGYEVKELLFWQREEGTAANQNLRAGLAILRIAYPGDAEGMLLISCRLGGTNPGLFEGIIATHTTVSFYATDAPQATLFEVVSN